MSDRRPPLQHVKGRAAEIVEREVLRREIVDPGPAVGHAPAPAFGKAPHDPCVLPVAHGDAVFRQPLQEIPEGQLIIVDVFIIIVVVAVDVQHHRDGRAHFEEGGMIFAGLRHEGLPGAQARAAAQGVQLATDVDGRIHPALGQDLAGHGGGGGLAVGAADADPLAVPAHQLAQVPAHQLAQKDGPFHLRDAQALGLRPLRVIRRDRRGKDDEVRPRDVFRPLADKHPHALVPKGLYIVGLRPVRAGDHAALVQQEIHQPGHAGPADADHMYAFSAIIPDVNHKEQPSSLGSGSASADSDTKPLYIIPTKPRPLQEKPSHINESSC